jgi:ferritin-like metal-binding protein YciE
MEKTRENYLAWLRDAHAMEEQALTMMQGMAARLENYPRLRARIESHITETREQAQALSGLLERKGSDTSLMKDTVGKMAAFAQSLSGMFTSDEVVKGTLASFAFENMEIASYRILITAAEQLGDGEAVDVFTRSLKQEEAMADWLASHSPEITRSFLSRAELDLPADP